MIHLRGILLRALRWIDDAALGFSRMGEILRRGRRIKLVEQTDGSFAAARSDTRGRKAQLGSTLRLEDGELVGAASTKIRSLLAGSRVEVILAPSRFVFRELELPVRAADFLEGVVREQIDRLTPWRLSEAAFGWSAPARLDEKRILVTVAATTRASITALAQAVALNRANSVMMSTGADHDGGPAARICVFSQRGGAAFPLRRWRQALIGGLALVCLACLAATAAVFFVSADLDAQEASLRREIATRQAALVGRHGSQAEQALAALDDKKRSTPPDVLVIEALSKTLPDSAYLTELRVERGKLQIAGLAEDAPGLIGLIEQSQNFTRARFTAPTISAPNEHGERFHIEADVDPTLTVRP